MRATHPVFAFLPVFACSAAAQSLSSSKISAHFINSFTVDGSNILAGHPLVFKILDKNDLMDSVWQTLGSDLTANAATTSTSDSRATGSDFTG